MRKLAKQSLGDLVNEDFRRAEIFEHYQLDFCCGGRKSLEEACAESQIELTEVCRKLSAMTDFQGGLVDISYLSADQICDYIVRRHHSYVRENIPIIIAYLEKVYAVHGRHHPQLATVLSLFGQLAHDLLNHLEKEETLLFPLIRQLSNEPDFAISAGINLPVEQLIDEHHDAGNVFREIAVITDHYTAPGDACNTFRVMLSRLRDFERDLHVHVHIENNILFPRAQALQEQTSEQNL